MNHHVCLRLLCFSLQVLVKPHKLTRTDTLTAAGTDVAILGYVHTESRLAEERVFVFHDWAFFFYAGWFKVWSRESKEQPEEFQGA